MKQNWTYKKFSEVFNLQMGKTPSRDNLAYWGGNNVWVSIADLKDKYIESSKEHITDIAVSESGINKVPQGTAIMSFKLTIGRAAITKCDLFTNEAIMSFEPKEGKAISADYIYYYLKGCKWTGANKAVKGQTLNKKTISENVFSYPSLSEQSRIVSELDLLQSLIDKQKAQLKELDTLAQSIFYDMFGDPVENEKGWEVKRLEEIVAEDCHISYGIVQPGDGVDNGIPVVRPIDMTHTFVYRTGLKQTTKEISDSYKRTILKGNEILLCVRGTTGLVALATEELVGCNVTRGIAPIECDAQNNRWFVYYQFLTKGTQQYIADYTKGIALKQINMKDVRDIPFVVPPLSLQQEFAEKIEKVERQKTAINQSIAETQKLFDYTMDKYFG